MNPPFGTDRRTLHPDPPMRLQSLQARYGSAVAAIAVVTMLELAFAPIFAPFPLYPFATAITLIALFAGAGPALVALLLASLAVTGVLGAENELPALAVFNVLTLGVIFAVGGYRKLQRETEALRASHAADVAAAIEHERGRLQNIVASVPGVVWEAWGQPDTAGQRIDFVSEHVQRMLGYSVEEWLATPNFWLDIVHPDDRERAGQTAAEHFARGGTGTNTFRWLTKDGRTLWVEGHALVIAGPDGQPVGMRGVTMDVTARMRAEQSLRFLNEVSEILGSSLELEATLSRVAHLAIDRIAASCIIEGESTRLAEAHRDPEQPLDRSAASVLVTPLDAHGRNFGSIALLCSDLNAYDEIDVELASLLAKRVAAAIENAQLYRAAIDASHAKDEFLATISHELRTPMTATLGWVRLLQIGTDPATQRTGFEAIERSTRAQARLIDDILDVSSIILGKFRLETTSVELPKIIDAAIETLRPATEAKNITIDVDTAGWSGLVRGDASRLQQVVWNLASNAIKFGRRDGRITVRLRRDHDVARLTVSDDGAGIDPLFLPHVFDRFRQAESGMTRTHGGLGLGLAIVRHLVELHGGSVRATSPGLGLGATFVIELPVLEEAFVLPTLPIATRPRVS